jgi:TRAP-type C4-dicarboxylate transport system permease small subunit
MVADELSGYLLVAISFLGLSYAWKERGHIRIRVLISRLPIRVAKWIRLITLTGITLFTPVLIKALYDLVAYSWESGERSYTTLRIPLKWPQMFMIIGAAIFFILILSELIKAIKSIRSGEVDEV